MTHFYLINIQYLGFRYHGWQKQPKLKTVHLMIDKTLNYVFGGDFRYKTLAAGRTDAMVSANNAAFELFLEKPISDYAEFLTQFNYYLPQDIRALSITEVDKDFNVIQNAKLKEYLYLFAHGQKAHPFCAPIMTTFRDVLDIELMVIGAKLFEGLHNFKGYCSDVTEKGLYQREVLSCQLIVNTEFSASFFPEDTFILRVKGEGFGYNQIRIMMGALVQLGRYEITLEDISNSLKPKSGITMNFVAPASGLILNSVVYN